MLSFKKCVALPALVTLLTLPVTLAHTAHAQGVQEDEKVFYYLHDHLGSIEAVTDEDGNIVERRDFLPFGKERLTETLPTGRQAEHPELHEDYSLPTEQAGFTGKELDSETGLHYYGSRYYDSEIGRFTSVDPLVLGQSSKSLESTLITPQALNGYSYVSNNPLRYVDEEGEYGSDVHYNLTYYLALKSGIDKSTANEIAFFNDRMDTAPSTSPGYKGSFSGAYHAFKQSMLGRTAKYHFASKAQTSKKLTEAISIGSPRNFGKSLHSYQDSFSHGGLSQAEHVMLTYLEENGHTVDTDPDNTVNNISKAYRMAKNSFEYMRAFHLNELSSNQSVDYRSFSKETDDTWKSIRGDVRQYLGYQVKSISNISEELKKEDRD